MKSVARIRVREDFRLELKFDNGEKRVFDARPYLERGAFKRRQEPALFKQACVAFDTVCWPGNLDITPEPLYARSAPA